MCSPGKEKPAKKDTQVKFDSPKPKTPNPKTANPKTPKSNPKMRGGLPNNFSDLTVDEALAVANFLKDNPDNHPDRLTFDELPGKPRIRLSLWVYDPSAPFLLVCRKTGCHYIPKGEKADGYLLKLMINEIREKNYKVTDPNLISNIFNGMNGYAIQGALGRAEMVFKNASLLQYLDHFAQKEDVQKIINQIHGRFVETDAAIKAVDTKVDTLDAKVDKVDAKVDKVEAKSLLDLRRTTINHALRVNPNDTWARTRAATIDGYLGTLPTHTGLCYRGIDSTSLPSALVLGWNQVGSVYADEGFTTASLSRDVAWNYAGVNPNHRVVCVIQSKTGRIIPPDIGFAQEEEISFQRGTKFLIRAVHTFYLFQPNQHMLIQMEEMDIDDDL